MEYEREKTSDLEMRWITPVCYRSHTAHCTLVIYISCLVPVASQWVPSHKLPKVYSLLWLVFWGYLEEDGLIFVS